VLKNKNQTFETTASRKPLFHEKPSIKNNSNTQKNDSPKKIIRPAIAGLSYF
jgi:hypothetical protein